MNQQPTPGTKPPIINCHTHIFTGDHVPPFLAKTFLPFPFYYLLPLSAIVAVFRFWYNGPYRWQFKPWYNTLMSNRYKLIIACKRVLVYQLLSLVLGLIAFVHVFFILAEWLSAVQSPDGTINTLLADAKDWLQRHRLLYIPDSLGSKLLIILIFTVFYKTGRNALWFLLTRIWTFLSIIPGKQTRNLINRYISIGRFAFYRYQVRILGRLIDQYPEKTGFVVLPMDMEFMEAGELKENFRYAKQMEALAAIKGKSQYADRFFPFIFADPRRFEREKTNHFDFKFAAGKVDLTDCFVKTYLEDRKFSGIKIYPALGYYPFDEVLLPLWKYAADRGIPILTHCIKGTIFYRGKKDPKWDAHPVFEESHGKNRYRQLQLLESRNIHFINNFTHPLNYLCLLDETLLRKVVGMAKDSKIKQLFGYTDANTALKYDLGHLKLCFGHFGGEDEWEKFLESDRDNYASQLIKRPSKGIDFLLDEKGKPRPGKIGQIWKHVDWYSIICSMMLQYPNVYADISYIVHDNRIQPLLKKTLENPVLQKRVLFGTDFYVVRNHKTEKNMLFDVLGHLDEDEIDHIARTNPRAFLENTLHGRVLI